MFLALAFFGVLVGSLGIIWEFKTRSRIDAIRLHEERRRHLDCQRMFGLVLMQVGRVYVNREDVERLGAGRIILIDRLDHDYGNRISFEARWHSAHG